jgi:hypothetical protein
MQALLLAYRHGTSTDGRVVEPVDVYGVFLLVAREWQVVAHTLGKGRSVRFGELPTTSSSGLVVRQGGIADGVGIKAQ